MAELDIAERRLPQDGRISLRIGGRAVDVRVSTLPSAHGERVVLRLLDKAESKFTLEGLGMSGDDAAKFDRLIKQPHGIILVTGPTGSGKTTTLYASLGRVDTAGTNILTVEDPVEYELAGIGQTQVNAKIDLTFAKALRAILRQDPDVIMIGEIRDHETAQIAIQASLTGHLVLATVHTNDAPSTVTRLIDMGVEPFLLSSSLIGVLAQRLVRKLCLACRKTDARGHWHPVGCAAVRDDRLQGPHRRLRADGRRRRDPRPDPRPRRRIADPRRRAGEPACTRCARTASGWSTKASRRPKKSCASRANHDDEVRGRLAAAPRRCPRGDAAGLGAPGRPPPRTYCTACLPLRSARRHRQGAERPASRPTTRARRARSCARSRWCRSRSRRSSRPGTAAAGFSFARRVFNATGLAVWTRQLAGLVGSGLPLERALTALADEAEDTRQRELVAHLRSEVNAGAPFARALASAPREFDEVYRGVVAAGEQSGALGIVLERLADDLEARQELKGRLVGATLYPAIVSVIAVVIVVFLVTYVVPQVATVFTSTKRSLPLLTIGMMAFSDFLRSYGWLRPPRSLVGGGRRSR